MKLDIYNLYFTMDVGKIVVLNFDTRNVTEEIKKTEGLNM